MHHCRHVLNALPRVTTCQLSTLWALPHMQLASRSLASKSEITSCMTSNGEVILAESSNVGTDSHGSSASGSGSLASDTIKIHIALSDKALVSRASGVTC